MAALDLDDQIADHVRELYIDYLGREPESAAAQNNAVQLAKTKGLDLLRSAIFDSPECQARRKRLGLT